MNRLLMIAALILALGVTWQIQRLLSSEPSMAATLEPGVQLPTALSFPSERCWVGYFVDPNCPFCRDLMAQAHDRDDLRWIIGGEEPLIDSLLGRFPVNPRRVRRATVEEGRPHPFHALGIFGVPTRVIGDGARVLHLTLTGAILSPDSVQSICNSNAQ